MACELKVGYSILTNFTEKYRHSVRPADRSSDQRLRLSRSYHVLHLIKMYCTCRVHWFQNVRTLQSNYTHRVQGAPSISNTAFPCMS